MCNTAMKSCSCSDVPVIYDMTKLQTNETFYGINETAVNASLTSIGNWDAEQIKLVCKRESYITFISLVCDINPQLHHFKKERMAFLR